MDSEGGKPFLDSNEKCLLKKLINDNNFDLDDTIIKHDHNKDIDYDKIKPNSIINELLISCPCDKKYIFTISRK